MRFWTCKMQLQGLFHWLSKSKKFKITIKLSLWRKFCTWLITINNLSYNWHKDSKLYLTPIFKQGKQKLTNKKNDYYELVGMDHFISKSIKWQRWMCIGRSLQLLEISLGTFFIYFMDIKRETAVWLKIINFSSSNSSV